jgi:hypothetical protein
MKKKGNRWINAWVISLMMLVSLCSFSVIADGETLMNLTLDKSLVSGSETFTVGVYCVPGQPIKSYECSIGFNATLLQANEVTVGDIFDGYSLFTNNGTIDNINGEINNIYGLIMGEGNVSDSGYFIHISFTAREVSGTSEIRLISPGVTNETAYVPLIYSNTSVDIDASAPVITDQSPSVGYTGDSFVFNISISDDRDDSENLSVFVDWVHGGNSANDSMVYMGGSYFEKTITLDTDRVTDLSYQFYSWDSQSNTVLTSMYAAAIYDNDPPSISDVSAIPSTQTQYGTVNLSSMISDNIDVDTVNVNITCPNASSLNLSVISANDDIYYLNRSFTGIGSYGFFFYAEDSAGNKQVSSSSMFVIADGTNPLISDISVIESDPLDTDALFGWVNFSCIVSDDELDQVHLVRTNPDASVTNTSMSLAGNGRYYLNMTLSLHGNYSYYIWANDTNDNQNNSVVSLYSMPPNWDINKDGKCNLLDYVTIGEHFGETGQNGWIREDVDNNGEVKVLDIVLAANEYGTNWW